MKLKSLKDEIFDTMFGAVKDAIYENNNTAVATVNTVDGYIDLRVNEKGETEVVVAHDDRKNHKDSNIESFCAKILKSISWLEAKREVDSENELSIEDEYTSMGEMMFAPSMRWQRIINN